MVEPVPNAAPVAPGSPEEEREVAAATVASESARIAELARVLSLTPPDAETVPLPDTPELVQPAARLFVALAGELQAYGVDAVQLLQDSRYDALTRALESLVGLQRDRVELHALRGVERALGEALLDLRGRREAAEAEARRRKLVEGVDGVRDLRGVRRPR